MSETTPTVRVLLELLAQDFARELGSERERFEETMDGMRSDAEAAGSGIEQAFAQLGVRPSEVIQAEAQSLEQAFDLLRDSGSVSLEDLARAEQALQERTAALNDELGNTSQELSNAGDEAEETGLHFHSITEALLSADVVGRGLAWISEQIGDLTALADAWANLKGKIDLAAGSESSAATSLGQVQAIAQDAASDLGATGDLYATLARALKSLNDEETSVADLTRTIAQTFQISGASAEESEGTIIQLSQALASGVLRGDEFNSVMEQAPRLSQALADSLGVTTGQLRNMAEAGELTAQTVIAALSDQAEQIAAEAATLPQTFERATTRFRNSLTAVVGGLNEAFHASEIYSHGSELLANTIVALADIIEGIGGTLVRLAKLFSAIPTPVKAAVATMTLMSAALFLLGTNLTLVIGYLRSLATGLSMVAIASVQSFIAKLAAAGQALSALWALMLANPLTALAAGLAVVTAGIWAYREASKQSIETLQATRDALSKQIDEVEKLRRTLATATPDSEEFKSAEQRLAQVVPGLSLDLDEQGHIVARLGEGYEDNARKVDAYTESLKQQDFNELARQLVQQYEGYQDARGAADQYTASLERNYGASEQGRSWVQKLRLAIGRLDGSFESTQAKASTFTAKLREQQASLTKLGTEALASGRSLGEIATSLEDLGYSRNIIREVVQALRDMQSAEQKALEGLNRDQRQVVDGAKQAVADVETALQGIDNELERLDKSIADHQAKVSKAQDTENEGWNRIGETVRTAYQDRTADIDAFVSERAQAIARGETDERSSQARLSELQRQANAERLEALREYEQSAMGLLDDEYRRRLEVAQRSGQSERDVNIQMLQSKRSTLEQIASAYHSYIDQLNAEEKRHLDAVKSVNEQIRQLEMSGDELVRELRRGTMSEYEAYQDRRQELAKLASQTERALSEGDYQLAQELAEKQIALARQQATEVKEGDQVLISKEEGTQAAIRASETALAQKKRALEGVRDEHTREAQAAKEAAEEATGDYESVRQELDELREDLEDQLEIKLRLDTQELDQQLDELGQELEERSVLVQAKTDLESLKEDLSKASQYVKDNPIQLQITLDRAEKKLDELSKYAESLKPEIGAKLKVDIDTAKASITSVSDDLAKLDGYDTQSTHTISDNAADILEDLDQLDGRDTSSVHTIYQQTVSSNAAGGLIRALATGGPVFAQPQWDTVPGAGNEDSVPAGLRAGSYVLNKRATRFYGAALLDQVARFASGGIVPAMLMPGERLFPPETVSRFGAGFFDALNGMHLAPDSLEAGLAGLMEPVRHFAAGGLASASSSSAASTGHADEVTIRLTQGKRTVTMRSSRDQAKALGTLLQDLTSRI